MPRGRFRRTLRGRLTDRFKLWLHSQSWLCTAFGALCGALDSACGIQRSRHGSRPSLPEGNEHGFKDFFSAVFYPYGEKTRPGRSKRSTPCDDERNHIGQ
jgi:hypothetical protein